MNTASRDFARGAAALPDRWLRVGKTERPASLPVAPHGVNPPLDQEVEVTAFGPRELAVTWRGASCDSNTTLVVEGTPDALRITIERGLAGGCSGSDVVYDSVLELDADIPIEGVEVDLVSRPRAEPPSLTPSGTA